MSEFDHWPHVILGSRDVKLTVLVPDLHRGYYRGPRFDWAGTVALAEWKGHTFFGSWRKPPHNPRANDDSAGTAGEFGMGPLTGNPPPIGYDDAPIGGEFLKVGVGRLRRTSAAVYSFGALHRIVQPAFWDTREEGDRISFTQVEGPVRGHAFRYIKVITVREDPPGFTIEQELENTGASTIVQTNYCHNFIRIDDEPIGPGYRMELPWQPRFSQTAGDLLEPAGSRISIRRCPGPAEGFFALVEGYGPATAEHSITVRGQKASLCIQGSERMVRFQVFGTGRTLCPEPFVLLELAPGTRKSWSSRYIFTE
jgi:hypothetical protein